MVRATPSTIDEAFVQGLRELGYTVGGNAFIEYRWAGNDAPRVRSLAEELARLNVDVIVTATTAGTRAAMQSTRTIPIVMAATSDPVSAGLVTSLGRPGGNVTGMSLQTIDSARKRLQQVREIIPGATRIAVLAEQRVVRPIQERLTIAADARIDPDRAVRLRVDEEAVNGFERCFVTATMLSHAADHVGKGRRDRARAHGRSCNGGVEI